MKNETVKIRFEKVEKEEWSTETRLSSDRMIDKKIKQIPLFQTIEIYYDEKLIFTFQKSILFSYFSLYRNFYINKIVKMMYNNS